MQQHSNDSASALAASASALSLVMLAALSACGGGGDSSPATVSSMSIASTNPGQPVYGQAVIVTLQGTSLGNIALTAPGCKNISRLTASPNASNDTTAYYQCTPSGAYTSTITATTNGTTVATQTLTVPAPIVTMNVSGDGVSGSIVFNLKGDKAPITVDNFLAYVNSGFYNGLIFHRVANYDNPQSGLAPYNVVQGGSYAATSSGTLPTPKATTFAPITLETTGGNNVQWTAAMARSQAANSATSGFFFNLADNSTAFDTATAPGYAVFADVSGSAAIITAISQAPGCTALSGFTDGSCVPIPNVTITSATQTQ